MNTTENNKLIAEFLGWTKKIDKEGEETPFYNLPIKFNNPQGVKEYIPLEGFIFDTDWNWLMEVVEKIESLGNNFIIEGNRGFINIPQIKQIELRKETKIEAVYNACVEFIKWYNEQK